MSGLEQGSWIVRRLAVAVAVLLGQASTATAQEEGPAAGSSPAEIAERYGAAVVVIRTQSEDRKVMRQATGFAVDRRGGIATCLHVLDGAHSIRVRTADGRRFKRIFVRAFDAERDLAVLAIDADDLPPIPLGRSDRLESGDPVVVIGNPRGLARTVTEGVLSAWREPRGEALEEDDEGFEQGPPVRSLPTFRVFQISAQISPGSSGGPVFDRSGTVVGLAAGSVLDGSDLNFAIPVEALKPLVDLDWRLDLESFQERADGARDAIVEPHLAEARLALALGRDDQARWELDQVLSMHPRSLAALLLQAGVARRRADFTEAAALLQRATRVEPESPEAWYQLGDFLLTPVLEGPLITSREVLVGGGGSGPSARAGATDAFGKALELDEDHAGAALGMGTLLFTDGRFREASRMFQRAIEADPDLLIAGIRLGESHMLLEEFDRAAEAYGEVLKRDSDSALAHYGMARVTSARFDLMRARDHWRRFLELARDDPALEPLRERTLLYLERYLPEALPRG